MFFLRCICTHSNYLSAADTTVQNSTLLFTDDTAIQCIAVSLSSVTAGPLNEESCLSLNLSVTSSVSGLTLNPSLATICIVPSEGEL